MRLVYFSPVPWASFAQRPHKFVDWFHRRFAGHVLWVEPYPGRLPRIEDFRRPSLGRDFSSSASPPWLRIIRVKAIPLEPIPLLGEVNRWLWRDVVSQIATFVEREGALIVIAKPSKLAAEVVGKFAGVRTVYDAMDDFPMFYSGLSRWMMGRMEAELLARSNAVWCSSQALRERIRAVRSDVVFVPNALDRDMVSGDSSVSGSDSNGKRVFGYVGTIGAWFDWPWVMALARHFPRDEIRLIGPAHVPPPNSLPRNIRLLPACDQKAAIDEMRAFDVGLIPFSVNELTASVDPVKYYEYRGLGLPVVSTPFGEMSLRATEPGVFLSHDHGDIPDVMASAMRYCDNEKHVSAFCESNNWQRRFDEAWASSTLPQG